MLLSLPPVNQDDDLSPEFFNSRFNAIADALNGNLDDDNIAPNAIGTPQLQDASVSTPKIQDNAVTPAKQSNPYKFHAYLGTNQNGAVSGTIVSLDTEAFDTNNNFNTTTFRYVAPVSGFYLLTGNLMILMDDPNTAFGSSILKNGTTEVILGAAIVNTYGGSYSLRFPVAGLIHLDVTDYVQLVLSEAHAGGSTLVAGSAKCYMSGFLVEED